MLAVALSQEGGKQGLRGIDAFCGNGGFHKQMTQEGRSCGKLDINDGEDLATPAGHCIHKALRPLQARELGGPRTTMQVLHLDLPQISWSHKGDTGRQQQ